jgi:hypothetical protein
MKKEQEKRIFKLYAFINNDNSISLAEKNRFSRITAQYVLVYTDDEKTIEDKAKHSYIIIRENDTNRLSKGDKEWLTSCNLEIIFEEAAKNQDVILQSMDETLKKLEQALEEEKIKLQSKGEEANGVSDK